MVEILRASRVRLRIMDSRRKIESVDIAAPLKIPVDVMNATNVGFRSENRSINALRELYKRMLAERSRMETFRPMFSQNSSKRKTFHLIVSTKRSTEIQNLLIKTRKWQNLILNSPILLIFHENNEKNTENSRLKPPNMT